MNIIEKIYEAYIAGELNIKPKICGAEGCGEAEKYISKHKLSGEQALDLDLLFSDAAARSGREMFFAGFKLAAEFMRDIAVNSENGIEP